MRLKHADQTPRRIFFTQRRERGANFGGVMAVVVNDDRAVAATDLAHAAIDAGKMSAADAALVRSTVEDLDRVLGVVSLRRAEDAKPPMPIEEIEHMIEERKAAKQRRDFAEADRIRTSLADRGVLLEDGPSGTRWKKK